VSGDNFSFDITGAPLELSLQVAFSDHKTAVGWADWPRHELLPHGSVVSPRLVLFWTHPTSLGELWHGGKIEYNKFPTALPYDDCVTMVKRWLGTVEYGEQPDHDGDNGKGWRVYNEAWTHVGDRWEAFVAIEPEWIWYGK
jgi:hypothetical protein